MLFNLFYYNMYRSQNCRGERGLEFAECILIGESAVPLRLADLRLAEITSTSTGDTLRLLLVIRRRLFPRRRLVCSLLLRLLRFLILCALALT